MHHFVIFFKKTLKIKNIDFCNKNKFKETKNENVLNIPEKKKARFIHKKLYNSYLFLTLPTINAKQKRN